jgi:hypothetical protein
MLKKKGPQMAVDLVNHSVRLTISWIAALNKI